MKRLLSLLVALSGLLGPLAVQAHESLPASLDVRQVETGRLALTFRTPLVSGQRHPVRLQLPAGWIEVEPSRLERRPRSVVEYVRVDPGATGPAGGVIRFPGLEQTVTDVFVRFYWLDGGETTALARPGQPWAEVVTQRDAWQVAWDYHRLGVEHILSGFDHLAFVLALLLIVSGTRRLLITVTSFTLAHSITLAAATLGVVWIPGPPIEATIALSILFLASELVKLNRGQASLTARAPWTVAFVFGLLHGFGFAGALGEVGLPQNEVPLALLMFNVGVEIGQLLFIAVILVVVAALRRLRRDWPTWVRLAPAYGIGGISAFWLIERVAGF